MDKSRLKQVLETMLMNDVPMSTFQSSFLDNIKKGDKTFSKEDYEGFRKDYVVFRDKYDKIDISRLDKDTGKSIIEECQPLVKEFYEQFLPLFDKYFQNGFRPQQVPKRLFDIRDRVISLSKEYNILEDRSLYKKAWHAGYFSSNADSRYNRFHQEKSVEIHPEKLNLVLEYFNQLQ